MGGTTYRGFRRRRLNRRNLGIVFMILGLLLMLALRFRLPFAAAVWIELGGGIALVAGGFALLAGAYGMPVREVLLLAADRRGAMTPGDLVTEMELEMEDARRILERMARDGVLRKAENAEAYVVAGGAPPPPRK